MDPARKANASVSVPSEGRRGIGAEADLTGTTLGDYKILRRLGQGGMGQVFLAEQISLKRKVALKLLKPELAGNKTSLARFKAEAEAVAKATHANIVQVYAIHEIGGIHLMALEFVEGRNLREFLEKKGPPEVLLGLSIMRQVAAALQRASELGIIHRDIKPENILLTRKGEVKVADFGLSRVTEDGAQPLNLTESSVTMGTPLYMSPEQVKGEKTIDHRTDIYSFGVTCYHMFAGHPPFRGSAPFEVALQHVQTEPKPLAEIRPDLPTDLCVIIHKMMAKTPADRYESGGEIVRHIAKLRDVLVAAGQTLPQPASFPETPLTHKTLEGAATMPMQHRQPSPWARRLLLTAIPLALAGGLLVAAARNYSSPPAAIQAPVRQAPTPPFSSQDREKFLLRELQELNKKQPSQLTVATGLNYSIELGLLYLNDRARLDDADRFFTELRAKQPGNFKLLGRLGEAMVLAFKDQPNQSNKLFLTVLDREKSEKEKFNPIWKNDPTFREALAKALYFNFENSPTAFPEKLKPYLHPPAPTLRSPKKDVTGVIPQ